jgi:hypothetical protein
MLDFVAVSEALVAILAFALIPIFVGCGLLLATGVMRNSSVFATLAPAFLVGAAVWSWFTSAGYFCGMGYSGLGLLYVLVGLVAWGIGLERGGAYWTESISTGERVIVLFGLLFGATLFFVGSYQDPSSDTLRHLALIRRIMAAPVLNDGIFVLSRNEPYDLLGAAYAYNSIHVLYAWVAELTASEPTRNFFHQPAITVILLLSAHYWLAQAITKNRRAASVYTLIVIFLWALLGFGLHRGRTLAYPESFAYVAYIAWSGFLLQLLQDKPGPVGWSLFCIITAGLMYVHSQWWLYAMLTLAVVIVWFLLQRQGYMALVVLVVTTVSSALSLPLLLLRMRNYAEISGQLGSMLRGYYDSRLYHWWDLYGFNPFAWPPSLWIGTTSLWALGALFIWAAMRQRLATRGAMYVLPSFIALVFYAMWVTPLTMLVAEAFTTTLAWRLFELVILWGGMAIFMGIYGVREDFQRWWLTLSDNCRRRLLAIAVFVVLLVLLLVPGIKTARQSFFYGANNASLLFLALSGLVACGLFARHVSRQLVSVSPRGVEGFLLGGQRTLLVAAFLAVVLYGPGSSLAPWQLDNTDRQYAVEVGPLIEQVLDASDFQKLLHSLPEKSVVVTDQPSLILAFRNIYIAGTVHGLTDKGHMLESQMVMLYAKETSAEQIYRTMVRLGADYIVFSPRNSVSAAEKMSARPDLFTKIYDRIVGGITYLNCRYVVYQINKTPADTDNKGPAA